MVKSWWLYRLKTEVSDTLDMLKENIGTLQDSITIRNRFIDTLEIALKKTKTSLKTTTKAKNSVEFFGFPMDKSLYKTIVWTTILILILLLAAFILLFNQRNISTRRAIRDLEENKEEFEAFRKRALEREQEVVRDLYEELKKYKKLAGE